MSKMGRELIEAMQELVDYSEGKVNLRTTKLNISPVREKIEADEISEVRTEVTHKWLSTARF
jgi:hypothetical protein